MENYAQQQGRYHPAIREVFQHLYSQDPAAISGLFRTPRDLGLFITAITRVRVHVLKLRSISSGRRAPGKRKNTILEFFCRFPREFSRFFNTRREMIDFIDKVKKRHEMRLRSEKKKEGTDILTKKTPSSTGSTPCFMLADHAIWAIGVLNKKGRHLGNTFDLETFEGFVYLMHEIYHNMQWYRSPVRMVLGYIQAVIRSLAISDGHIPWAHEVIPFEVEAITFHERLWLFLESMPKSREILATFRALK